MIEVNATALAAHPFLHGMSHDQLAVLVASTRHVSFPARCRIFEDGSNATRFWLIQSGQVRLDLNVPGQGPAVIEAVGMGELLGWSWLFPPYKWAFGAVAVTAVEAFEFDAPAVRRCCEADPQLGYELNQRITRVLAKRLQATRIRLIAQAGHPAAAH
jgi:CRP/FNR family transcriptional regulator, cyclic AMP receptor protein